jgi:polyisoprenoid-binding protein YceI
MSSYLRIVDGRSVPAAGVWKIDPGHTSIAFSVRHLLTRMRGRFTDFAGDIQIDEDPRKSSVAVTIQAASVDVANPGAEETLRGDRFLDVARYPTLDFESREVVPGEDGRWVIAGDLRVKGVAHPVELDTIFLGAVTSPLGEMVKMSFEARTRLQREALGIRMHLEAPDAPGVLIIGNTIEVTLDVEADLRGARSAAL